METKELWRTDDMALATYLSIKMDMEPELEWDSRSCFFLYPQGEALLKHVTDFISNDGPVDARTFNKTFAKLRKAAFDHDDSPKRRNRNNRR